MNLIFLGAPGSGKGTQSEFLINNYDLEHLSTGNLIREAIDQKTKIGLEMKNVVQSGKLVSDDLVVNMVKEKVSSLTKGFIFDGFPRTIIQAQAFDNMLKDLNTSIDKVLFLEIDKNVLLERLTGRLTCSNCKKPYHKQFKQPKKTGVCDDCNSKLITRKDDLLENAKIRIKTYENETAPLIEYYEQKGLLVRINANKDQKYVTKQIKGILK